jgi:hypothetical protein
MRAVSFQHQTKKGLIIMTPITLPVAELKPALMGLGKVVARRVTLPVISTIRIDRDKDGGSFS